MDKKKINLIFFIIIFILLIPNIFALKIIFSNVQSGVGATGGKIDSILKFPRYFLPHNLKHLDILANSCKEKDADIILLVELDGGSLRSSENQLDYLNKILNYSYKRFISSDSMLFFARPGIGILSKYPLIEERTYKLFNFGEKRIFQYFKVNINNKNLSIFVTHLGINESEREKQIKEIINILETFEEDYILVGDFNAEKKELEGFKTLNLKDVLQELTYPSWGPKQELDKFFITQNLNILDKGVMRTTKFSDHFPIYLETDFP